MLIRRLLSITIAALLLASVGCTGSRTPNTSQAPANGSGADFTDSDLPFGTIPVRMAPAEPQNPPFAPEAGKLASALRVELPSPEKSASFQEQDRLRNGADFDLLLPYNGVAPNNTSPSMLDFMPSFDGDAALSDLAFAMYDFALQDFHLSDYEQTIGLNFLVGPSDLEFFWVGVGDVNGDKWVWFPYEQDGVITVGDFSKYEMGDGSVRIALIALGQQVITLDRILIGMLEERNTGDTAIDFELPVVEFPHFFPPLDFSVDLSPECAPINDQGGVGACTAFATVDGALNYELGQLYSCWDFSTASVLCGPRFVYNSTGSLPSANPCPDGGRATSEVGDWLITNGTSNEEHTPFGSNDEDLYDCGTTFSSDALDDAALLLPYSKDFIGTWDSVGENYYLTDDDIGDIKTMLMAGRLVVFRTQVDNNFGMVNYAAGQSWNFTGPNRGGHAMCIVGFDNDLNGGSFKVRNSWGTGFGDNGYCFITYEGMKQKNAGVYAFAFNVDYDSDVQDRFCGGPFFFFIPELWRFVYPPSSDGAKFSWEAPPGVLRFKIYRDDPKLPAIASPKADETTFTDMTLQDDNAHFYWIQAEYGNGSSELSRPVIGWKTPPGFP